MVERRRGECRRPCLLSKSEEEGGGEVNGEGERGREKGKEGERVPSVGPSAQGVGANGLPEDEKVKMPGHVPAKD